MCTAPLSPGLLAVMGLWLAGCGACQQVAAHRDAFRSEMNRAAANDAPHIRLAIPGAMVEGWTRKAISRLPDVPVDLPGLGDLSRYVDALGLAPRSMRVALDRGDSARFDLDLDVKSGGQALFGLQLGAVAPVRYDAKKGTLQIALRADMFEKIAPRIDDGAVDRLSSALLSPVPSMLRGSLRPTAQRVAREGVAYLAAQAYGLLRRQVLTPLGELARFEFALPDVPLQGLALSTVGGQWVVDARLPFSAAGLPTGRMGKSSGLQMAVSTQALAQLGNWAMGRGEIPARYTREGKAAKGGEFEAGFGWQSGARPLKVHLWTAEVPQTGICLHARAGADPRVSLKQGKLSVGFDNGTIEEMTGPPLVSSALSLMGISTEAFAFTKTIATKTKIKLGDDSIGVEVKGLELSGDMLSIDLAAGGAPGS